MLESQEPGIARLLSVVAPEWIRTTTPKKAQALNLPRMPIPPRARARQIIAKRATGCQYSDQLIVLGVRYQGRGWGHLDTHNMGQEQLIAVCSRMSHTTTGIQT